MEREYFFGYSLFEVPNNLIHARIGARRWIARITARLVGPAGRVVGVDRDAAVCAGPPARIPIPHDRDTRRWPYDIQCTLRPRFKELGLSEAALGDFASLSERLEGELETTRSLQRASAASARGRAHRTGESRRRNAPRPGPRAGGTVVSLGPLAHDQG